MEDPSVNEDILEEFRESDRPAWRVYEPQGVSVVLGAGRHAETDVILEAADKDGVPVLKRRGGGGTVVLAPGQLVLALVTRVSSLFRNREYAAALGGWVREAVSLAEWEGPALVTRGVSDLAVGDRKVLGSSVYRSRQILFYQASLLVSPDLSLFSRYLQFPSRVPDYRRGRSHLTFCTSLHEQGSHLPVAKIAGKLEDVIAAKLPTFT